MSDGAVRSQLAGGMADGMTKAGILLYNFSSLYLDARGRNESLMRTRLKSHWKIDLFVAHYKVSGICRGS